METKVSSEIIIDITTKKETCGICLEDDINEDQMFYIEKCHHEFCSNCMKQYIEVRLLEGSAMRCPHDGCDTMLNYQNCEELLTSKVRGMWTKRIIEDWIPVNNRVYCPNPKCSALMSAIQDVSNEDGFKRDCVKCGEPFCTNCKVPWHHEFSCEDYKILHPNHSENEAKLKDLAKKKKWRQCGKCQNMIELSQGCVSIECRCGNQFCYRCGAVNGGCSHGHQFPLPPPWFYWLFGFVLAAVIAAIIVVTLYFVGKSRNKY